MNSILNRAAEFPMRPAVPGFEGIHRYWNPATAVWTAKILPGEYYVTREAEAVNTVLGSCISACLRDPETGVGGMNHFMLPEDNESGSGSWNAADGGASTRYGSYAMERLINELLKLGARRERLEVKLFGGGRILPSMTDVGLRNIAFAKSFLKLEGLTIAAQDLGDVFPRRVLYFPQSGRVLLKHLRAVESTVIAQSERNYRHTLGVESNGNDVELFD
jgi:chemotaxis protein CheD